MLDTLIIGGGISGLIAGRELARRQKTFLILEAEAEVGGRVRSEKVEGFTLDRGFQILLSAYPWVERHLDLDALGFRPIKSGALIWDGTAFQRLVDPVRHPQEWSGALTSKAVTWGDRLRLAGLAATIYPQSPDALLEQEDAISTADYLKSCGFSAKAEQAFLRPFFAGIFLEDRLATASNFFRFLFRTFGTGSAGVPARGMGAIPKQLADSLPPGSVRCGAKVVKREGLKVHLANGEVLEARTLIAAVDQAGAEKLGLAPGRLREWHGSVTEYFAAPRSPVGEPLLALNGTGGGIVNSVLVLSDVAPELAPADQALISVGLRPGAAEEAGTPEAVRRELKAWYGEAVDGWRHLRSVAVPHSLLAYEPGDLAVASSLTKEAGVFLAGDLITIPSQEGAARAGEAAAAAAAAYLATRPARVG